MAILNLKSNLNDFRKSFSTPPPKGVENSIDTKFGTKTPISDRINSVDNNITNTKLQGRHDKDNSDLNIDGKIKKYDGISKVINMKSSLRWKDDVPYSVNNINDEFADGFVLNQKSTAFKKFDYVTLDKMLVTNVTKLNSKYDRDLIEKYTVPPTKMLDFNSGYDVDVLSKYDVPPTKFLNFKSDYKKVNFEYYVNLSGRARIINTHESSLDDIVDSILRTSVLNFKSDYKRYDFTFYNLMYKNGKLYFTHESNLDDIDVDLNRTSVLNFKSDYKRYAFTFYNLMYKSGKLYFTHESDLDDIESPVRKLITDGNSTIYSLTSKEYYLNKLDDRLLNTDTNLFITNNKKSILNGNISVLSNGGMIKYATEPKGSSLLDEQYNKYDLRSASHNRSYIEQPYVLRGIQRKGSSDGQSWGVPYDFTGVTTRADADLASIQRLTKFELSPRGLYSSLRQSGLQIMNPAVETIGNTTQIRPTQTVSRKTRYTTILGIPSDRHGAGNRQINELTNYTSVVKHRNRMSEGYPLSGILPSMSIGDQGIFNRMLMLKSELLPNHGVVPTLNLDFYRKSNDSFGYVDNSITRFLIKKAYKGITGNDLYNGQVINKLSTFYGGPNSKYGLFGTFIHRAFNSDSSRDSHKYGITYPSFYNINYPYSVNRHKNHHLHGNRTYAFNLMALERTQESPLNLYDHKTNTSLERIFEFFRYDAQQKFGRQGLFKVKNSTAQSHLFNTMLKTYEKSGLDFPSFYDIKHPYASNENRNFHMYGTRTLELDSTRYQKTLITPSNTYDSFMGTSLLHIFDYFNSKPKNESGDDIPYKKFKNTTVRTHIKDDKGIPSENYLYALESHHRENPIAETLRMYSTNEYLDLGRSNRSGKYNDFRFDVNSKPIFLGDNPTDSKNNIMNDPSQINIEKNNLIDRYGVQDGGKVGQDRSNLLRTKGIPDDEITKNSYGDKINLIDYRTSNSTKKISKSASEIYGENNPTDLIKFFITGAGVGYNNVSGTNTDVLVLRAFLNSNIVDNFNASWDATQLMGRGDQVYNYNSFSRDISLGFKVIAFTREEMKFNWRKLNYLASYTAPDYSIGATSKKSWRIKGPIIRLTIGDLYSQVPGFITSLSYNIPTSGWELAQLDGEDDMLQLPKEVDVTMNYTTIGNYRPEKYGRMYDFDDVLGADKAWLKDSVISNT